MSEFKKSFRILPNSPNWAICAYAKGLQTVLILRLSVAREWAMSTWRRRVWGRLGGKRSAPRTRF